METKKKVQLVSGIIIGSLILITIYVALSVESFTTTPRHIPHEIEIDVEISYEEDAVLIEVKQSILNLSDYTILVGNDKPFTVFKNLTNVGSKGDTIVLRSEGFNPIKGEVVEVAFVNNEDSVVIWRKDIEVD